MENDRMIVCRICNQSKEQAPGQGRLCAECSKEYQRQYRLKNQKRLKAYWAQKQTERRKNAVWVASERKRGREYWANLRDEAIMAYGGYRCACCGETEQKFLTLDHVFNDGAVHRKKINNRGAGIFKWLKDHGYPAGFQILCMNCNHGKALNGGVCPHRAKSIHANDVKTGEAQTG